MTEIVDRLRAHHGSAYMCQDCYGTTMDDAADEIERLTAENERLRKLLDAVANQGWQEIDDDLRRQIRAYQQQAVNSEE